MIIFKQTKAVTYEEGMVNLIAELIDEFLFHVEQARKSEFESNLQLIQKSIDKVTREISEIKETGNYYYRRKKRNEKNYDERELLYISDLIRALPEKDRVGIFEIIEEKPFQEITTPQLNFELGQLKPKKVREIEYFAKRKLINHYRSRERKAEKKARRREEEKWDGAKLKVEEGQPRGSHGPNISPELPEPLKRYDYNDKPDRGFME